MTQNDDGGRALPTDRATAAEPVVSALRDGIPSAHIKLLWGKTHGKAWEPQNLKAPLIVHLIDAGYLKRCAMRCGFEAFDTGVDWTDAGKVAAKAIEARSVETARLDGDSHESAVPQGFANKDAS